MISAVFGTVKSLFLYHDGATGCTNEEPAETAPAKTDDDRSSKSPYDSLQYGQSIGGQEQPVGKETSSFSGQVTDLLYGYGLINNDIYFAYDCVVGGQRPALGTTVDVVAIRDHDKGGWKATQVRLASDWDADDGRTPQGYNLVGMITKITQDTGFIDESVPFDQDSLVYGYKPCRGDWIQGEVTYSETDGQPQSCNVRPLREQKLSGTVTHVYPGYGHVDGKVYFSFRVCEGGWRPKKGDAVDGKMIESKQSKGNWRAVSMKQDTRSKRIRNFENAQESPFAQCMIADLKRNQGGITITDKLDLGSTMLGDSESTTACIRNIGQGEKILSKYEVCCPTGDVTVVFSAASSSGISAHNDSASSAANTSCEAKLPIRLPPQSLVHVTLTIKAKQLGKCLCQVSFAFGDFEIRRLCSLTVQDQHVAQMVAEGHASGVSRSTRTRRRGRWDRSRDDEAEAYLIPGIRPVRNYDVNVPVKLPQYPIPRDMKECVLEGGDLIRVFPQLAESLCLENFSRRFSALLHLEEIQMEEDMREFDLEGVSMRPRGEFLSLEVPGLAEGRPSVLIGDKIILTHPNRARYEGFVHEVLGEAVLLKFHPSFHELYQAEECSVMFTFSRTSMRRCHQACAFAKNLGSQVIFPTRVEAKLPQVTVAFRRQATVSRGPVQSKPRIIPQLPKAEGQKTPASPLRLKDKRTPPRAPPRVVNRKASPSRSSDSDGVKFFTPRIQDMRVSHVTGSGHRLAEFVNPRLNARQRSAVARILQGEGRPLPYVIFGPPGTGKTVTVVEAILQVHIQLLSSRILACTPSNSAADLLTERLHDSGKVNHGDLVRLNAFHRMLENVPAPIKSYCKDGENLSVISHQRIIVCTCSTAGSLYQLGLKAGHFSHVFVDEAGQATEPECLVPAGLAVGPAGQIILAGDPMQLGPVLSSHTAKQYGLGQSYLERLIQRTVYRRDAEKYRDHGCYDPLLVTKLVENYRSHPALLKLSSQLFYHNELQAKADRALTHSLTSWEKLPNKDGDCPLLFHGVMGSDMREGNSPSWFNPVEVVQVIRYVQALLNSSAPVVKPQDVGIITPYRKQVEKVKLLLTSLGIQGIKVGSVEEFQGQERVAMVISTVRSSEDLLTFDLRHHLGFLSNPKRFNVSISRAQALMVVVGNPYILAKDEHWRALLRYCLETGAYTGCQPPTLPPVELCDECPEEGREPDMTSPGQQDKEEDAHAASLKDCDAADQRNLVHADDLTEKVEVPKVDICDNALVSPSSGGTVDNSARGIFVSPKKSSVAEQRLDRTDVESEGNHVGPNVGIVDRALPVADEGLLDSVLSSEASRADQRDHGGTENNSFESGAEVEKHCTVSHREELACQPASLMDKSWQDSAPSEQLHLLNEDNRTLGEDTGQKLLPTIQRTTSTDQASVRGDVLVDKDEARTTFVSHFDAKKQRAHSSLSFSSVSDSEECGGFLDDLDLHSKFSAGFPDVVTAGENLSLNEEPIGEPEVHQEANKIEVLWSSGTFSDPEVCDPDGLLLPDTCDTAADMPSQRSGPVISSSSGKLPGRKPNHLVNERITQDGSTVKPVEITVLSDDGSAQVCDQDEEDPEVWDGQYNHWHVQPRDVGCCGEFIPAAGTSELPAEVTEKWDDYTWEVRPKRDVSESLHEHAVNQQGCACHVEAQRGTLELGLPGQEYRDNSSQEVGGGLLDADQEMPLLDADQEMPPLEDWSQAAMDITDNSQDDNGSLTSSTAAQHQGPDTVHQQHQRVMVNSSKDISDELNGNLMDGDPFVSATSSLPSGWQLGRGRGMLHPTLKQGGTAGDTRSSLGGHTSCLRNPWKVSAPSYDYGPHAPTPRQPSQPAHHADLPLFGEPQHAEMDCVDCKTASPGIHSDYMHEAMALEGSVRQAANCNCINPDLRSDEECHQQSMDSQDGRGLEDWDNCDGPQHPHFFYKKPPTIHRKGGKWKYAWKTGTNGGRSGVKSYTTDEDFMGEAQHRVVGWNQGCCGGTGAYPVGQSTEMMDDYDVIIESNEESDSANAFNSSE